MEGKICQYKDCAHKGQEQPLEAFQKDRTKADGHCSMCRECRKIYKAKYSKENREILSKQEKEWRINNPEKQEKMWKGSEERKKKRPDYRYNQYKIRAKGINRTFNLTLEQFNNITSLPCYYCGQYSEGKNNTGIDRIDSTKGYEIDNVRPCCYWCNTMKLDKTEEAFREKLKVLYEHYVCKM